MTNRLSAILSIETKIVIYIVLLLVLRSQDLRVGQEKKPCIGFTQENSIKSSVQDCLSYIPQTTSLYTTLAYSK